MKNIKKPEIIVITAMDETGLIGNGNIMPWRSSVDFNHFKKQTTSWPCIFGKNTALGMMPNFPLKNRPCAIVSNKMETQILPASFQSGAHLAFGPGPFYDALGEALRFFKNYDKIFIAGGAALYQSAMHGKRSALWETGDHEIPLV
ncbi:dihydrofolate reductase, partial [Lachnospiraceae bacterium OttesenSCG-928-E19]|nr:dihydrofolate reductase [Lachnospiraceae bacterium OttesenSCG-928-E19]